MKVVIKDEFDFDVKPSMIWLIIAILTNEYIDNNEYEMSFLILKGSSFQRYGLQKSKGNVQINQ